MRLFKKKSSEEKIEKPEQVETISDLRKYILYLAQDSVENPDSWQNGSIESYLECISSWMKVSTHLNKDSNKPLKPSDVANLFYIGKIYE